eukprot:1157025-Pelagomonas_calceolata.AAC.9
MQDKYPSTIKSSHKKERKKERLRLPSLAACIKERSPVLKGRVPPQCHNGYWGPGPSCLCAMLAGSPHSAQLQLVSSRKQPTLISNWINQIQQAAWVESTTVSRCWSYSITNQLDS